MQKYKINLKVAMLQPRFRHDIKYFALKALQGLKLDLYYPSKDVADTFKPYKTQRQLARDLVLQPFKGFFDTLVGIGSALVFIVIVVPSLLVATGAGLISLLLDKRKTPAIKARSAALFSLMVPGMAFVAAFLHSIRGIAAMITWPLTLTLRLPLRAIITAVKGVPKIEDSKGLRAMIAMYENDETSTNTKEILSRLLIKKYSKAAFERGQRTNINSLQARMAINLKDTPNLVALFKTAIATRDQSLPEKVKPKRFVRLR